MYKYKRNGFTLVELMAVIIIISLIALLTFPNIINQIKKTKNSNNKMIEDVVIEQAKKYVNDNKDELLEDEYCMPISTLIDNDYIKEDIVNINDIKDNKVVHITLDNNNSYEVLDKNKCFLSAVKYLLKKTNPITVTDYTDGDIHEMYTFNHEATEQTPALTDYRYIGNDPNNYVEFNNELWRIIGVFKVEDENGKWEDRIKIVRDEPLKSSKWDENNINEWISSMINMYLNETYDISDYSKLMISKVKYYLGGRKNVSDGSALYNSERSEIMVSADRSKNWLGLVGLIYPSDYIYTYSLGVDDICYNTPGNCRTDSGGNPIAGWLYKNKYQWTMTPNSSSSTRLFRIVNYGILSSNGYTYGSNNIYPVVYLSSKVKITSGDGLIDNAYKLSI